MEYRHKVTGILVNSNSELPSALYEKKQTKSSDAATKKVNDSANGSHGKVREHKNETVRKR